MGAASDPKGRRVTDTAALLIPSPSESERFGLLVGRLTVPPDESADEMLQIARDAVHAGRFELVIVRLPRSLTRPAEFSRSDGIEVIDAGCTVTYGAEVDPFRARSRAAGAEHMLRRIERWGRREAAIVEEIFAGYRNHVAANPRLDASLVPAGYADWSARHVDGRVSGDCFMLVDTQGQEVAFAAVATDEDALVIDLAGVLPTHRGHGVYQVLLDLLEADAAARELTRISISTQVETVIAIRAWERRGWIETAREWTLHLMPGSV